jgi:hypothetical protein
MRSCQIGPPGKEGNVNKVLAIALLMSCLLGTAVESRADKTFTVTKDSLLFSQPGFLVRIVEPGVPGTTFFAFEYDQMIQIYAERLDGSDTWEVFNGRQYLCQAYAMAAGNVWRFLDDELTGEFRTAEVVSTESVDVGGVSFIAWRVDIMLDSTPGMVEQSLWFTGGVGIVKQVDRNGGAAVSKLVLRGFSVTGIGFFPLEIGNNWEYGTLSVADVTGSVGVLKARYHR